MMPSSTPSLNQRRRSSRRLSRAIRQTRTRSVSTVRPRKWSLLARDALERQLLLQALAQSEKTPRLRQTRRRRRRRSSGNCGAEAAAAAAAAAATPAAEPPPLVIEDANEEALKGLQEELQAARETAAAADMPPGSPRAAARNRPALSPHNGLTTAMAQHDINLGS